MPLSLPAIAGYASTALFVLGTLPMLAKAFRTRNLASYSLGNILMSNAGNLIYSIYVFSLPRGPVWFLHAFNLASTALMLAWYLRYECRPFQRSAGGRRACLRAT
jgi:uncharacterized protein with PQ loop repeat